MACFWFEYLLLKRQDAYSPDLLHLFANAESLSFRTRHRNAFRHGRAAPNRGFRGIIVDKHALRSPRCVSVGPLIPQASRERSIGESLALVFGSNGGDAKPKENSTSLGGSSKEALNKVWSNVGSNTHVHMPGQSFAHVKINQRAI